MKQAILDTVQSHASEIYAFLRSLIAVESYDSHEQAVITRIREEMVRVGFDRTEIDPMGNLLGYIGNGSHLIAMDGHCDTVSCSDRNNWEFDPFSGMETDELIGGLGSSDQKGGIAAMVYAGLVLKELGLTDDFTLLVVASVQEEDYDGLCWKYIIEEDGIRPEFVVLTEPCDRKIRNGQRGRMEIRVDTKGISSHGSTPELGVNAIYHMGPVIGAIKRLHGSLQDDGVLGKGSITISEIRSTAPSRCAVSDSCSLTLDRRTNSIETKELVLDQIRSLKEVKDANATVGLYHEGTPSWTGLLYSAEKYYPAWILDPQDKVCQAIVNTHRKLFDEELPVVPWQFSTNGVSIMGIHRIPCVGYGPGHGDQAHKPNEVTWKQELLQACAVYAFLPFVYLSSS